MMSVIIITLALIIDWLLGEAGRWHPLAGFGRLTTFIEHLFYTEQSSPTSQLIRGGLAWLLLILPITALAYGLNLIPFWNNVLAVIVLYLCIGHKSLYQHVRPIVTALQNGNEAHARELTGRIVSRDKATLDVPKATIESVLENGNDAVFAALFWFMLAGLPGVVAYRLVNTLDAMWGYKNTRYLYFGRIAARMDDLMNYLPARLTALSYALLGRTRLAIHCWQTQASQHDSPNAGPVMASGAGALDIELGGPARYHGQWHQRPVLGSNNTARPEDIDRALKLVSHSVLLWLAVYIVIRGVSYA